MFYNLKPEIQVRRFAERVLNNSQLKESCLDAQKLSRSLRIQKKFAAFAGSLEVIDKHINDAPESSYVLIRIDTSEVKLTTQVFPTDESVDAESKYIAAEKEAAKKDDLVIALVSTCLLYTSPSPRDRQKSRMPSSA